MIVLPKLVSGSAPVIVENAAPSGMPAWGVGWGDKDGYWITAKEKQLNIIMSSFH